MVNTKHDTHSYESTVAGERGYQREIFDGNALYDAYKRAKQGSDWKPQVQHFEMTYLLELSKMQRQLEEKSYPFHPANNFVINERGKTRYISGERFPDRVVKHSLCDEILSPSVKNYLIYDNGASQTGKGIDFARKRLLTHLRRYYAKHQSNEGYILLVDFSKYYDNIRHDVLMELFRSVTDNEHALYFLEKVLERSEVDVSYLTDEEYAVCMDTLFDSLKHGQIDRSLLTGEKFMAKHLNIGDQVAQVAGIAYPMEIDNYIKIVRGIKYYGRYMDDSYVISDSKEHLQDLLKDIVAIASHNGIIVNTRKTRICKLSDHWRFLQVQYSLTDTGRIIKKINPKRLTCMRRKMKKLAPRMTRFEFWCFYYGWFKSHYKFMSKQQRENLDTLYEELKEVCKDVQDHTQ